MRRFFKSDIAVIELKIFSLLLIIIYIIIYIIIFIIHIIFIITIIIIIIIINIILLLSLLIYLFSFYYYFFYYYYYYYFWIGRPIRPEGSPFDRFFILGCCELKEVVSTQTYLYNPSIQPSRECLVINWMVNSCYGPYQL